MSFLASLRPLLAMAYPATPLRMTAEEYLAFDAAAPPGEKYEFYDGWVVPRHGYDETGTVAMAGASPEHNDIGINVAATFHALARKQGCRAGAGDQRVRSFGRAYVYPDFVLACGEPVYSDDTPPVLETPSLVLEITSTSTVAVDRGQKLTSYTQLDSLQEYWILDQEVAEVTRFARTGNSWRIENAVGLDATMRCDVLGVEIALADLYAGVDVDDQPPYAPGSPS
ncbi:MAG: Uma2 family endonuclease [Bacteroidota bacterium]